MIRDSKGVTLVEVLAAVVILSLIVIGFVSFSENNTQSNRITDQKNQAIQIAENILNDTRSFIAANQALPNDSPATNVNGYYAYIQSSSLGNISSNDYNTSQFQGKQHISMQAIVYLNDQPQLITVTVYWGG